MCFFKALQEILDKHEDVLETIEYFKTQHGLMTTMERKNRLMKEATRRFRTSSSRRS